MQRDRSIASKILSNWGAFAFAALVNFFLSPIVVRSLGETQYGVWVLLGSLVGHLGLLDIGVRAAVTRYVARFHTSGEHDRARRLYSSALRIFVLAGAVAVVLALVMSSLLGRVFKVPPELVTVGRAVAVLGGVSVAVSLVGGVFGGVLIGLQRFERSNAIEISVGGLRALSVLICLRTGQGLIALSIVQLGATAAQCAANWYYARAAYPEIKQESGGWDRESAVLLLRYGVTASLLQVSYAVMFYSDSLIIGAFLPVAMITPFSIGSTLIDYGRALASGITQTLSPRVSALEAKGQDSAVQSAFLLSARMVSIVVYPIAATFITRGGSFVALWMGPSFQHIAGQVLIILSFNLLSLAGYQAVSAAVYGVGKHVVLIPMFVIEAVCNIGLSILLIQKWGVIGTAIGTMAPRLIVSAIVGPWYAKRTFQLPLRRFWLHVFVRPALAMLAFAAASYAIEVLYPAPNLLVYFAQVLATLPLAAAGVWTVCLSKNERNALAGSFIGVGSRLVGRP